jgi:hypothetical protein
VVFWRGSNAAFSVKKSDLAVVPISGLENDTRRSVCVNMCDSSCQMIRERTSRLNAGTAGDCLAILMQASQLPVLVNQNGLVKAPQVKLFADLKTLEHVKQVAEICQRAMICMMVALYDGGQTACGAQGRCGVWISYRDVPWKAGLDVQALRH